MKKTYINVQKEFKVAITFDDSEVPEELLLKLTRESIEKLGYNIIKGEIQ